MSVGASVRLAPPRVRPRPVFCVIDGAYRNRAVADEVSRGLFTHAGTTLELGLEPDWLGAQLPADEEWRIEWVKFYYGLDLGHAYAETGAERFRQAFERLVRSWIDHVDPAHDPSEVTARRISNWVYAWCRFDSVPGFGGFTEELEDELAASLEAQAAHVRANLTPARNHRTLELYSLLILALALPELDPDDVLLELALAGLVENLLTDLRPDGVHCEASTHYHMVVLRSALGTLENARRFGLPLPTALAHRVERACEFALHAHRPDGGIAVLSDGDAGSYRDLLTLASSLLGRPDFLYAATAGGRGTPPRTRCASFPDGGYHVQRSGWGEGERSFEDELFLMFDCGPLGEGGHGHYDLLSVEVAAAGGSLLVDPGRFTYSEGPPNLRRWFKGTAAHNTVCVDGRDQTAYRRGKPKGPVARGRLLERLGTPGFDLLRGLAASPRYDAVHERAIAFMAGEYWLIVDRLRAGEPHDYDLRFHLAPEATGATRVDRGAENAAVRAPGLALAFAHGSGAAVGRRVAFAGLRREARRPDRQRAGGRRRRPRLPHAGGPARGRRRPRSHAARDRRPRSRRDRARGRRWGRRQARPGGLERLHLDLRSRPGPLPRPRGVATRVAARGLGLAARLRRRGSVDGLGRAALADGRRRRLVMLGGRLVTTVATDRLELAPDPQLPQRDVLLDPDAVAERLRGLLGSDGELAVGRCERVRAKYQVGRSLRVLHRIEVDGERHLVSARTFAPERAAAVYVRALATAVPTGTVRPVVHDPELATVFWTFPNDRKIAGLRALTEPPRALAGAVGGRWARSRLVAYAPEKSATVSRIGERGRPVAFVKAYAGDEGERTHRIHSALEDAAPVAGALAYSPAHRVLAVEPIDGRPVAALARDELEDAFAGLGSALAGLHRSRVPRELLGAPRLEPARLASAAAIIGAARPDVGARARALAAALAGSFDRRGPDVCLHGDVHPKNGILGRDGVVLIDLDQVCAGPAAADLGGLLAGLAYARCVGELAEADERRLGEAVVAGYADAGTPPAPASLRWHTAAALLAERGLRAVHRVRRHGLRRLDAILEAAEEVGP